MNRQDLHRLFAYSDNCWQQLEQVLSPLLELWNVTFETTSEWNTIRLLLVHSIAAEERLVSKHLLHGNIPVKYEVRAGVTLEEIVRDHKMFRLNTYKYISSLNDDEISSDEIVVAPPVFPRFLSRSDVLFQIISHETFHRGEIITALQRLGIDPPDFDYVDLKSDL